MCELTEVTQPTTAHLVLGHMHMLGRSIEVELNPGTARARTLLDVPDFDFDNQELRQLSAPVDLKPRDTLQVTCTHDATLRQMMASATT